MCSPLSPSMGSSLLMGLCPRVLLPSLVPGTEEWLNKCLNDSIFFFNLMKYHSHSLTRAPCLHPQQACALRPFSLHRTSLSSQSVPRMLLPWGQAMPFALEHDSASRGSLVLGTETWKRCSDESSMTVIPCR